MPDILIRVALQLWIVAPVDSSKRFLCPVNVHVVAQLRLMWLRDNAFGRQLRRITRRFDLGPNARRVSRLGRRAVARVVVGDGVGSHAYTARTSRITAGLASTDDVRKCCRSKEDGISRMDNAGSLSEEASPGSTGHVSVLLVFLLFSFVLRTKLCLFLLFLLAFISFSLITHIRFSLLEPTFPKWRLLSNVTEPPHRYRTQRPVATSSFGRGSSPLTPTHPMPAPKAAWVGRSRRRLAAGRPRTRLEVVVAVTRAPRPCSKPWPAL